MDSLPIIFPEERASMGNREAMLELIGRAYAARGRGDLDELMTAFHPEAVFTLTGDKRSLEVAGTVQGHRSLRETFAVFIATFDFVHREILNEVVEGDRAAVHSRLLVRYKPTGAARTTDVIDLFTFQDGKIIELVEAADNALLKDVLSWAS